jgi:hypothetical protein
LTVFISNSGAEITGVIAISIALTFVRTVLSGDSLIIIILVVNLCLR